MKRLQFIKTCGFACMGATSMTMLLQGCVSARSINTEIVNDQLVIPKNSFFKNGQQVDYIIASNKKLRYPIYLFRFSDTDYSALYLRCTHQGNQLNAYGDKLVCSAHGSEFNNNGKVTNGPADRPLRAFPVSIKNENILISLKTI